MPAYPIWQKHMATTPTRDKRPTSTTLRQWPSDVNHTCVHCTPTAWPLLPRQTLPRHPRTLHSYTVSRKRPTEMLQPTSSKPGKLSHVRHLTVPDNEASISWNISQILDEMDQIFNHHSPTTAPHYNRCRLTPSPPHTLRAYSTSIFTSSSVFDTCHLASSISRRIKMIMKCWTCHYNVKREMCYQTHHERPYICLLTGANHRPCNASLPWLRFSILLLADLVLSCTL